MPFLINNHITQIADFKQLTRKIFIEQNKKFNKKLKKKNNTKKEDRSDGH